MIETAEEEVTDENSGETKETAETNEGGEADSDEQKAISEETTGETDEVINSEEAKSDQVETQTEPEVSTEAE